MSHQPSDNLLEAIHLQLRDYTGFSSRINRFFYGMWNRNHIPVVESILEKLNNNQLSLPQLFSELFSIRLINPHGSLSHIIHSSLDQLIELMSPEELNIDLLSDALYMAIRYYPSIVRRLLTKIQSFDEGRATATILGRSYDGGVNALFNSIVSQPTVISPILDVIDNLQPGEKSAIIMHRTELIHRERQVYGYYPNTTIIRLITQYGYYLKDEQISRLFDSLSQLDNLQKREILVREGSSVLIEAAESYRPKLVEGILHLMQDLSEEDQNNIFKYRNSYGKDVFSSMNSHYYTTSSNKILAMISTAFNKLQASLTRTLSPISSLSLFQPAPSHPQLIDQLTRLTGLHGWKVQLQQGKTTLKLSIKSDQTGLIKGAAEFLGTSQVQHKLMIEPSSDRFELSFKIEDVDSFLQAIQSKLASSSQFQSIEVEPTFSI